MARAEEKEGRMEGGKRLELGVNWVGDCKENGQGFKPLVVIYTGVYATLLDTF